MLNKFNLGIQKFTSNQRTEISGIYVSPREVCATNGYMLMRVQLPKFNPKDYPKLENERVLTGFKPFILPKEEADKILSNLPRQKEMPILENAVILKQKDNLVEFGISDLTSFNKIKTITTEGEFPRYKEILVKKGRHIRISVNPKFLKTIAEFFSKFSNQITIEFPVEKEKPIHFLGENKETGQKVESLLMPMKSES